MAIPLTINGVTFQYPQQFDKNWGPTLTNWSSAVTSGMLQKAGGSFPLTAEVDFGGSFGMKVLSIKSEESNIATTGFMRLANASTGIVWRNASNSADLVLTVNSSNQLTFNGTSIGATTSLTNSHILVGNVSNQPADVAMSGDITITNAGVTSIGAGKISDSQINASAAITLSKLAPTTAYYWYVANASGVLTPQAVTASRAVATDSNGLPTASSVTSTELGYLSGVTSAIQTQINGKLSKSGDTMSGVLNMGSNKIISVTNGSNSGEVVTFGGVSGSTANSGGSQGAITQGTISTPDFRANAVTQVQSADSGDTAGITSSTIVSKSITTTGGKVLILAHVNFNWSSGSAASNFQILRDTTQLNGMWAQATATSTLFTTPVAIMGVDSPAAGTYTYKLVGSVFAGGGNYEAYAITLIELKA